MCLEIIVLEAVVVDSENVRSGNVRINAGRLSHPLGISTLILGSTCEREKDSWNQLSPLAGATVCRLVSAIGPLLWVHWVSGIRASDRYFGLESVTVKEKCCMFTRLWPPQ